MKKKLILVRHGQSIYNLENKFTGWKDVGLTEQGKNEALNCADLLDTYKFDICYTSKLKRAQHTLNIILINEFNVYADINQDGQLNVLDIVLLVNLILES